MEWVEGLTKTTQGGLTKRRDVYPSRPMPQVDTHASPNTANKETCQSDHIRTIISMEILIFRKGYLVPVGVNTRSQKSSATGTNLTHHSVPHC